MNIRVNVEDWTVKEANVPKNPYICVDPVQIPYQVPCTLMRKFQRLKVWLQEVKRELEGKCEGAAAKCSSHHNGKRFV